MDVDWASFGQYSTDAFTDEAVKVIRSHNSSRPLFLYLAHAAPHAATFEDPLQVPEGEERKFVYLRNPHRRRFAGKMYNIQRRRAEITNYTYAHTQGSDS